MTPSRTLPLDRAPAKPEHVVGYLSQVHTRLTNWVDSVAQSFSSRVMKQVDLSPLPDGSTVAFTSPYVIEVDAEGIPNAQLIDENGRVLRWSAVDPPTAGHWTLRSGAAGQEVVLPSAPASGAQRPFFSFLVAR